jgi:hypothetical protein
MYCKTIVAKVPHWDRNRQKKSSFFVVDVERGEDDDVIELIGNAKVDFQSMRRFLDWQKGDIKDLGLLVSIDLKHVIVATRHELPHVYDAKEDQIIQLKGEVGVHGTPEGKFLPLLKMQMGADPELAERLGMRRNPAANIPARMRLEHVHGLLESMDAPIQKAYFETGYANADALIFAFLSKENVYLQLENFHHQQVELEVWGNCERDNWREGGPLNLYDTKGLTVDELVQRRKRALKNRNAYWRKFPNPFEFDAVGGQEAIEAYLARFSSEELVEMAVVAWYSSTQLGAREKSVVIAASARFGVQNDWA